MHYYEMIGTQRGVPMLSLCCDDVNLAVKYLQNAITIQFKLRGGNFTTSVDLNGVVEWRRTMGEIQTAASGRIYRPPEAPRIYSRCDGS